MKRRGGEKEKKVGKKGEKKYLKKEKKEKKKRDKKEKRKKKGEKKGKNGHHVLGDLVMIIGRACGRHSSSVFSSCLLKPTLRGSALYVSCGASFHSCNQAFRHVDYLFFSTCSATMFAVYLLSDPSGPPKAFLLFRPQCTVGVLAGTHWGALRCPDRLASVTKRQSLSAALLLNCSNRKRKRKRKRKKKKRKKKTNLNVSSQASTRCALDGGW